MAWTANIPQPNDRLSVSQGQLLGNCQRSDAVMAFDHYPFSDVTANAGFHKSVRFPAGAAVATDLDVCALYAKTVGTRTQIFFRQDTDGAATEIQMTGRDPIRAQNGCTFLPGNMLLQWGHGTFPAGDNTVPIAFPVAFSAAAYSVVATRHSSNSDNRTLSIEPGSTGAANVTFRRRHDDNPTFTWIAIGPA